MAVLPRFTDVEFRSKEEIDGWPLVHINLGINPKTGRPKVAKGVVAIGNVAYGVVSIGVAAFGVVTLAVFGLGVVSLASIAMGVIALGAVALGYEYALGVVVHSAERAIGLMGLDWHFVAWSLLIAATLGLVIRLLKKARSNRLQS